MTDQELKNLVASLAESQNRTDEQLQATDQQLQQLAATTEREREATSKQLREVSKQIGGLSDKFGSFTEGLALPSMTKILNQRFGMNVVAPRVRARRNGQSMEVDVLAYSNANANSNGDVFVVEVKSRLREEALDQIRRILRTLRDFFPEYKDKKVYGILAAVDIPTNLGEKVLREGIYLAGIHDDEFELQVPEGFQPRAY